ncbi:hemolysin family protein [Pasteurella skyensis]|uniref:Polyamine export protein n=1 Tax=Phocoenobacter skyensis TaxID=97481 RepID=A0AAJ6NAQ6_9PAST|nr:hemolysin family protein [Pasteurella skyensis]MDP8163161.1 hemolysin family protein [Pasteurella skyensis]MDP8173364.1 hemolysin family protein [Pasteurella skyensis]MDP8177777.1 hemolysin family protein [Pasteurella skyensis]MDP8179544.1 hemolysin family protein [Pasteurella skyensis]MDP8182484.1 hemolysin family protein [Pasteurella skyensis]
MDNIEILKLVAIIFLFFFLVLCSSFLSCSELSLAASRKFKIQGQLDNDDKIQKILALKDSPGDYFAAVQIGLNLVAIIAGAIGQDVISPHVTPFITSIIENEEIASICSSIISVLIITSIFIVFADLIPKKVAISNPEKVAQYIINPMLIVVKLLKPFIVLFDGLATVILKIFNANNEINEELTTDDIYAVVNAGAEAGLLVTEEQYLFGHIFNLKEDSVTSMMTHRDHIDFYSEDTPIEDVINSFDENLHQRAPIYKDEIDNIIGFVDIKKLLHLYIKEGNTFNLTDKRIFQPVLLIPDTLLLYEVLDCFKKNGDDFAIILNEYGLVVGVITLKDVMSIVMGDLVTYDDDYIVQRDESSWIISGATPYKDVLRLLEIEDDGCEYYETLSGLIMFLARRVPKIADQIMFNGFLFEIVSMEQHRIKQVLVTKK